jgi:serine/threonine protein kinase
MVKCKRNGKIFAMKTIRKDHVVKNNKVRHTLAERNIMQKIQHPFVMRLHYSFQTNGKLYMVMDYLNGGDIFYHLSVSRRFSEDRARFYAAEVLMALECLHEHSFIYRDLKPENVLTDADGHVRLTDFGLSKESYEEGQQMNTFVGTTEYLAPEVLKQKGYGKEVDWWSLGVLVFEMLTGCPPFYHKNRQMTFRMILSAELNVPDWLSPSAKALVRELLVREPTQRLGHGPRGAVDIKRHAFFAPCDFPALYRKVPPPVLTGHDASLTPY